MKNSTSTSLKNCQLLFEEDKVIIIESAKDKDKEFDLVEDILKKYEGIGGISIKIGFDKEI